MKRISTAVLLLLFVNQIPAANVWKQWKEYETWAKAHIPENHVALAQAPNGLVKYEWGTTVSLAEKNALRECKRRYLPHDFRTCRIVDVNLKSKGKFSTTTSTSGSKSVWCATDESVIKITESSCRNRNGKGFAYEYLAQAEHQRLKKQSVWCATDESVIKITESSCRNRNGKGFAYEYLAQAEHQRLKKQSVWCATDESVIKITESSCRNRNGKGFAYEYLAQAEHQRLKEQTTTASSPSRVHCATTSDATWTTDTRCRSLNGKAFSTKAEAEAEHKRLKNKKTTTTSTSGSKSVWCATKYQVWSTSTNCVSGVRFSNRAKAQAEQQRLKKRQAAEAAARRARDKDQGRFNKTGILIFGLFLAGVLILIRLGRSNSGPDLRVPPKPAPKPFKHQQQPDKPKVPRPVAPKTKPPSNSGRVNPRPVAGNPEPVYPRLAIREGLEGEVSLAVSVSASGKVTDISVSKSSGSRLLDQAALKAVRMWRFTPANCAGVPKHSVTTIPVQFRLSNRVDGASTRTQQREDPRERLLGIEGSWSIEKKRDHIRQEFNKWNARIASLSEGSRKNEAQEKLRICGELMAEYGC